MKRFLASIKRIVLLLKVYVQRGSIKALTKVWSESFDWFSDRSGANINLD